MPVKVLLVTFLLLFVARAETSDAIILRESERWIVCIEQSIRRGVYKCSEPRKTRVWRGCVDPDWVPDQKCPKNQSWLQRIVEDYLAIFQPVKTHVTHYRLFQSLEEAQSWCNKNCIRER